MSFESLDDEKTYKLQIADSDILNNAINSDPTFILTEENVNKLLDGCQILKHIYNLALEELKNEHIVLTQQEIDYIQSDTVEQTWISKHTPEEIHHKMFKCFKQNRKALLKTLIQNNKKISETYINEIYSMFDGKYIYKFEASCKNFDNFDILKLTMLEYLDLRYRGGERQSRGSVFRGNEPLQHKMYTNISFVSNLTHLKWLDLGYQYITDLNPISSLVNLTFLNLAGNMITDLTPLSTLTNLSTLILTSNYIRDISPLQALSRNLSALYLQGNENITNNYIISSLTNLQELRLCNNYKPDISFIAPLVNLEILALSNNQIVDISPLSNLAKLTRLYLPLNAISNLGPLSNLVNLSTLILYWNNISDPSPLSSLVNLTRLEIGGHRIADYSFLNNLTKLINREV